MLLKLSLFMICVALMLRFSSIWIGWIQKMVSSRDQKLMTERLDWDRPVENRRLRKPNAIVRFWRG